MTLLGRDLRLWTDALDSWTPGLRGGEGICRTCQNSAYAAAAGFGPRDAHELVHRLVTAVLAVADGLVAEYEEDFRRESDPDEYWEESAALTQARWRVFRTHAKTLLCRELVAARPQIRLALDGKIEARVDVFAQQAVERLDDWRLSQ